MDSFKREPFSSDEVIEKFELENFLEKIPDISITPDGDIELTRDFDIKIGNNRSNAFLRLVEGWRFNEPYSESLFSIVNEATLHEVELDEEIVREQEAYSRNLDLNNFPEISPKAQLSINRGWVLDYAKGASAAGRAICAGSIILILDSLIRKFKLDLGCDLDSKTWHKEKIGRLLQGRSFGSVLRAAANNFRHCDEWATMVSPKKIQEQSIVVISDICDLTVDYDHEGRISNHRVRTNYCADVLMKISDGKSDVMNSRLFEYSKAFSDSIK